MHRLHCFKWNTAGSLFVVAVDYAVTYTVAYWITAGFKICLLVILLF